MTMTAVEPAIVDALQRCSDCAQSVMAVLRRERALLDERDAEGLTALMPEKLEALSALEKAEQQRAEAAKALGYPAGPEGMQRLLKDHEQPELEAAWRALTDQLRTLQTTNEANGRLIHRSLEQTSEVLAILTGGGAGTPATYGSDGIQGSRVTAGQGGVGRSITRA
ncbi:flagella synthesis protein FlgN [Alkalispirillum mobile]|uniref:Flagella synthesis protein FlgN n=1 Tax=Alkalispirillum mobile TaxID=85925 RepID=A0A498C7V5_9GAMM|nr:flagellar protein FlgN [Alkalispirillum mobile]RLK48658.1 flagella synthesis protein FlgN [Alkalispirillum mobile]